MAQITLSVLYSLPCTILFPLGPLWENQFPHSMSLWHTSALFGSSHQTDAENNEKCIEYNDIMQSKLGLNIFYSSQNMIKDWEEQKATYV